MFSVNSVNNRVGVDLEILRKQEVEVKKIDDYCLENKIDNVDFLKIDVEGNELKVLEGSREMFKEGKIGVVQFEYGGTFIDNGILLKDAFVFFKDLPYTIYKILPSKLLKVVYSQDLENFQYSNYVVINNGIIGKINF